MKAITLNYIVLAILLCCGGPLHADESPRRLSIVVLATRDVEIESVFRSAGCVVESAPVESAGRSVAHMVCPELDIRMVRCGAGLVNAVMTAQMMIEQYKPDLMISMGLCAGLDDDLEIGDLVVAETFDRHDVGTHTDAGFVHGTAWYRKTRLQASDLIAIPDRWPELMSYFYAPGEWSLRRVCLVTGDSFIRSPLKRSCLIQKLGAQVVDTSGAAIASVADANHVPLVVIRQVSDFGDDQAGAQFGRSAALHAEELGELAVHIIEVWSQLEKRSRS